MAKHKQTGEGTNVQPDLDHSRLMRTLRKMSVEVSSAFPHLCSLLVNRGPQDAKVCSQIKRYYSKLPKKRLLFFIEAFHEAVHDLVGYNMKLARELEVERRRQDIKIPRRRE